MTLQAVIWVFIVSFNNLIMPFYASSDPCNLISTVTCCSFGQFASLSLVVFLFNSICVYVCMCMVHITENNRELSFNFGTYSICGPKVCAAHGDILLCCLQHIPLCHISGYPSRRRGSFFSKSPR